ncbi:MULTISPECIES: sensor histidine kinase [unclassified Nocardioides]|uniref:sensor histidine kinase n=1 Tax=unclassified Nocardioides TaxID=2615069 RepID=UPI0009F096BC|nr:MULTISPECIES: HAMP domain-containing sensor histidine kinase [unclassified Nocardioides]GAW49056.1 ATPase domain-containing protein [Nocardioides sp. PD653-B2]GAW53212.1 ATPase domain-containing protein [Nocardioides sp. PD653]
MTVSLPGHPLVVPVAADDLADVVDVLVDNVFAHTPDGTAFAIGLEAVDGVARLVVTDDGPGIAAHPPDRVGSTGLGLDIARRTATGCGGALHVDAEAGAGTRVEVRLPLAPR